jgi:hypothetical protein
MATVSAMRGFYKYLAPAFAGETVQFTMVAE